MGGKEDKYNKLEW